MKVLVSAYVCEPGKGSEPGVGWNWVKQIARFHEVWVITRENYRAPITQHEDQAADVHWAYFDLPFCSSHQFWRKRLWAEHIYYYLWQIGAYFVGKRLSKEVRFDLAHHVTYGIYWRPSFLALLPVPFIWGPVGVAESVPKALQQTFSVRGRWYERVRAGMQWLAQWDPAVRLTARRAALALAQTEKTKKRLCELGSRKVQVFSHMGTHVWQTWATGCGPPQQLPFRLVSVGRLIEWKGFHLALQAFARFHKEQPDSEYWLIGEGGERQHLEHLASTLGVSSSVRFLGSLPHSHVLEQIAGCHALIHPSLHDAAPAVCLEAMAAGLPVICLDIGGPALFVTKETGIKVAVMTPEQVIPDLTRAMLALARDPERRRQMGEAARMRVAEHFAWNKRGDLMMEFYGQICPNAAPLLPCSGNDSAGNIQEKLSASLLEGSRNLIDSSRSQ